MSNTRFKAQYLLQVIEGHLNNNNLSTRKIDRLLELKYYLENTSFINLDLSRTSTNPERLTMIEDILKHVNDYDLTFFKQIDLITRKITESNSELRDVIGLTARFNAYELVMGNSIYMALTLGISASIYSKNYIPLIAALLLVISGEQLHNKVVQAYIQETVSKMEFIGKRIAKTAYKNMIENMSADTMAQVRIKSYLTTADCATQALLSQCGMFNRSAYNQTTGHRDTTPELIIQLRRCFKLN